MYIQSFILSALLCLSAILIAGCAPADSALADQHSNVSRQFRIIVQTWAEWEPGLPRQIRQVTIGSDGKGQAAEMEEKQVRAIEDFHHTATALDQWDLAAYYALKNQYLDPEEEDPELIIEGYPTTVKFIFYSDRGIKIIDCHKNSIPTILRQLEEKVKSVAMGAGNDAPEGLYVMTQPLGRAEEDEVMRMTTPITLSAKPAQMVSPLERALSSPCTLVHIPDSQREHIQKALNISDINQAGIFVRRAYGITKVIFFTSR